MDLAKKEALFDTTALLCSAPSASLAHDAIGAGTMMWLALGEVDSPDIARAAASFFELD